MKKNTFFFALLAVVIIACDKGSFETKPELKVKSLSADVVPQNSSLVITLEFTDKEGDIDSALYFIRHRLNIRRPPTTPNPIIDKFLMPEFPNKSKGEIELDLDYGIYLTRGMTAIGIPGSGTQKEPDSLKLSFVLKDKAGNASDTVTANVIVIR